MIVSPRLTNEEFIDWSEPAMPHLFDTQLVSYAMNGTLDLLSTDAMISSTTAQELLLIQGSSPTRNNYYIPKLRSDTTGRAHTSNLLRTLRSANNRWRKTAGKSSTDRMILDFGREHPTVVEYSHQTLADVLNEGNYELLEAMASILGPKRHDVVTRRLRFLLSNNIRCVPLSRRSAEVGLRFFQVFTERYTLKNNFRNSLNDILTLAVADTSSFFLHTQDRLLAEFATSYSNVPVNQKDDQIVVDFTASMAAPRRKERGTKGYINSQWRVRG
jgi:hypothetical protein